MSQLLPGNCVEWVGNVTVELQDGDPRLVGGYTLQGRLGADEMGQVFLGWSPSGQPVAVKVIHPHLVLDPGFRDRFAREADAARRAVGTFIVPVIDADASAPLPWLATPVVDGPSLATAVPAHGPLPTRSVLALAAGLAEGLRAAHTAGVTHGDLTPANVLLTADGPRLTGFCIARAVDHTQAGPPPGSAGFLSPEQAEGLEAGPSSDLYSLGAVLLYAATGPRMPYFAAHLDQLSGELRPIIEQCLATDPAARPTAADFLTGLLAAHPAALNLAGWLPASNLPTGSTPADPAQFGARPSPASATAPAPAPVPAPPAALFPAETITFGGPQVLAVPAPRVKQPLTASQRKLRTRRAWLISIVALACVVVAAGTVYVVHPWPWPLERPAGLTASQAGFTSVNLSWSNPGHTPGKYEILRDGKVTATVPGNVPHFDDKGLTPATSYDFQVVATRGSAKSQPSQNLHAATKTPPTQDGVLDSIVAVAETVTQGADQFTGLPSGTSYTDSWVFASACGVGPCAVKLDGTINQTDFSVTLKPADDGTYTGSANINDYWDCNGPTDYSPSALRFTIKPSSAQLVGTQWQATAISGTLEWDVLPDAKGNCSGGTLLLKVTS